MTEPVALGPAPAASTMDKRTMIRMLVSALLGVLAALGYADVNDEPHCPPTVILPPATVQQVPATPIPPAAPTAPMPPPGPSN